MKESVFQLSAKNGGLLKARLDDLQQQFEAKQQELGFDSCGHLWSRLFMSDAANQLGEVLKHPLYENHLKKAAFSYVEQPPLDGSKVALMVGWSNDGVKKMGVPSKMILEHAGSRFLLQSVRFTADEVSKMDAKEQTKEAFRRHIAWLREEGLTLKDNCVRTWLFVRDIDSNYHDVVVGRNEIFAENGLTSDTHYIASTGIGGNGESSEAKVCVDFWSVDDRGMDVKYLQALDFLNPTHEYGVAFERGTSFESDGERRALISGTASIDKKGQCLHIGDVKKQADRLFENIDQLLADDDFQLDDIRFMYVYLRDLSDYETINNYLEEKFPQVPRMILLAPVCRPLWLIEVECIACKSLK